MAARKKGPGKSADGKPLKNPPASVYRSDVLVINSVSTILNVLGDIGADKTVADVYREYLSHPRDGVIGCRRARRVCVPNPAKG